MPTLWLQGGRPTPAAVRLALRAGLRSAALRRSGASGCFGRAGWAGVAPTEGQRIATRRWSAVRGRLVNRKRRRHVRFGASLRDLGDLAPDLGLRPRLRWFAPPGLLGVGMGRALGRGRR